MNMIPFAVPSLTQEEKTAVMEVLDNGWLTSGQKMKDFETALAKRTGTEVVCVNSATAGLHLALLTLGLEPGDEVIVPTITFAATAEVVKALPGVEMVLADVCPQTQMLRLQDIQKVYSPGLTKVIMLVHMAGLAPMEHQSILDWAFHRDIKVIEDAAHTFGARYLGGQTVGSARSYATVYSFYATKCITTGEGGAVCVRDPEVAARMRRLRLHGISRDVFDRYTANVPKWEYDVVEAGWKYNMTDLAAAIGLVQLGRNGKMLARRAAIALQYQLGLSQLLQVPAHRTGHAWHLYVVRVAHSRNEFIERLYEAGVGASVHFKPLHLMTAYREQQGDFPNAERYFHECVSLPIYADMTDEQVARVIEVVNQVAEQMYMPEVEESV